MKVFVSWSGPLSQRVACVIRDWLPCVLQYVRPYVSSEDIDKGNRWSTEIAQELSASTYGILCVTSDNQAAPWLNFEAGALSKAIDQSFVTPFLLNLKASELRNGPLIQFQATAFSQDEVRKLVESINAKASDNERVDVANVKRTFEKWWPELDKDLTTILQDVPAKGKAASAPTKQELVLEELLELVRSQQRHLSNPEVLLPPAYLDWALRRAERDGRTGMRRPNRDRLHGALLDILDNLESLPDGVERNKALEAATLAHHLFHEDESSSPPSRRIKSISAGGEKVSRAAK